MAKQNRKDKVEQQIDENLRRVYAEAFEQDVPERFTKLLDQLRTQGTEPDADVETDDERKADQ